MTTRALDTARDRTLEEFDVLLADGQHELVAKRLAYDALSHEPEGRTGRARRTSRAAR